MSKPKREELFVFGRKRKADYVRGVRGRVEGEIKILVLWNEPTRKQESFDDTRRGLAEAKAYAEGTHERLQQRKPETTKPLSLEQLYDAFLLAKADTWSENTLRLSNARWAKFTLFRGAKSSALLVTRETLDAFKRAMLTNGHAPNQVRMTIKVVTGVFRWGVERDLIPPTKLVNYTVKFNKKIEASGPKMAEFSADDRAKIFGQFDPRDARQWRPWALSVLLGHCGPRQTSARLLSIDDIALELPAYDDAGRPIFSGRIHWIGDNDKMGNERFQPMPAPVAEAMWVIVGWRQACGYDGPYLFFRPAKATRDLANGGYVTARSRERAQAADDQPWTYSAYMATLDRACVSAGVKRAKWQGAHAFRRGVAGDIHAKTGSNKLAADWIGDRSTKIVDKHYLLTREEELVRAAGLVTEQASAPSGTAPKPTKRLTRTTNPYDESSAPPASSTTECNEMQRGTTEGAPGEIQVSNSQHFTAEPQVGIEPTTARMQERAPWPTK